MAAGETFKGVNRRLSIPPCMLGVDDLRLLGAKLEEYAREAADREVAGYKLMDGQTTDQLEANKERARTLLKLVVQVYSDSGHWRGGSATDVLQAESLPDVVSRITFDTALGYRAHVGNAPNHAVVVDLNFARRALFDFRTSADVAEEQASWGLVQGADASWADGVHEGLRKYFVERRTLWRGLHGAHAHDVLLLIMGLPLTFMWMDRGDTWFTSMGLFTSPAIRVGVLIYIAVLLLYAFRLVFNLACRVFPRILGPRRGTGGGFQEAVWLVLTVAGWFSTLYLNGLWRWVSSLWQP